MIKCDSDKADAEFNNLCKQLTTKISTYVSKEECIDFDPVFCSFAHFVTSDLVDSKSILSRSDEYGFGIKREHVKLLKWKLIERCQNLK